jgi:hypothetical protein
MRNLAFVLMLVLTFGICNAQSATTKPVEPAAIGVVFRLDTSTQELKVLPDEQWKENKSNFLGNNDSVEVPGCCSSFVIKAGETIEFVFKTGSPEKVSLYRFIKEKHKRHFQFVDISTFGSVRPMKGLAVEVTKFGDSSYKLVPTNPLYPGEYGIMIAGEMFTFGVDE